tara:strand:- start:167 stop:1174 length:1008 start_codon:yes stop_codon:yes gene_type:complete
MDLLNSNYKIFVPGSNGMVGQAICRQLRKRGYSLENKNLLLTSKKDINFKDNKRVFDWFNINRPDIVIIAAAKVGGILANNEMPVDFLLDNLKIQNNLIEASYQFRVKRLLFLGSSCVYPKLCTQPIKEEYLLSGSLENTNEWYAIAKIAGIKLCQAYRKQYGFDAITVMPTNLYGPNDNYDFYSSHVMASFLRKFYEAKINNSNKVKCWGTGNPLREFLHVDDLAEACIFLIEKWYPDNVDSPKDMNGNSLNLLNIGSNFEISIKGLAEKIANIVNFKGEIIWDSSKPDGTPRKKLDSSHINQLGWRAKITLDEGIKNSLNNLKEELSNQYIRP